MDSDLRKLFSVYGEVSRAVIIRNRKSGRSMGSALIEMPFQSQAIQAMLALNGMIIDGSSITVSEVQNTPGEFNN